MSMLSLTNFQSKQAEKGEASPYGRGGDAGGGVHIETRRQGSHTLTLIHTHLMDSVKRETESLF